MIDKIGKVHVLQTLGSGAHSSILHVRRDDDSREYALKLVKIDGKDDLKYLEQAKHEYRVGQMLNHPNLVKVYCLEVESGWFSGPKKARLLIEYVPGKTMDTLPLQRMANVSLAPAEGGPSTQELIAGVEDGIYVLGDKSWSIDMQRYNFQFTGQRFFRIRNGRLDGQLRDVAYQATTTDFWGSMEAVGGPQTYVLGGAFNCGKGQPGQVAPVSHGCPAVLLRGVRILNPAEEGAA